MPLHRKSFVYNEVPFRSARRITTLTNMQDDGKVGDLLQFQISKVENLVENMRQLGIIVDDFKEDKQETLQTKLNEIVETMVDLNNLFVLNPNQLFESVEVPIDVLSYIDAGKNPDLYTKQALAESKINTLKTEGKKESFKFLKNLLDEKHQELFGGDISQEVVRITTEVEQTHAPEALYALAAKYSSGIEVPVDHRKAFHFYHKAAYQGHAVSSYQVALYFENGWGIPTDPAKAGEFFKHAFNGFERDVDRDARAANNLGICYFYGKGVERDVNKAMDFFHRAHSVGVVEATNNLAMYDKDKITPAFQLAIWF